VICRNDLPKSRIALHLIGPMLVSVERAMVIELEWRVGGSASARLVEDDDETFGP
jgi:hypothetical protein